MRKNSRGTQKAYNPPEFFGDYAMKAIADEFGVHYTTLSRAVKDYEAKRDG